MVKVLIETDDLLSVPSAAKQLNKPRMTLYRWIEAGKAHGVKFGGVMFLPKSEVERLTKLLEEERAKKNETG